MIKYYLLSFIAIVGLFFILSLAGIASRFVVVLIGALLTLVGFLLMFAMERDDSSSNAGAFMFLTGLALMILLQ